MRIAFITTSYPAERGDPSGHFVRAHARALAREGNEVHVVALGGSRATTPSLEKFHPGSLNVVFMGGARLFGWPGVLANLRDDKTRALAAPAVMTRAAWHLARESARGLDRLVAHWLVPSAFPLAFSAPRAPLEAWAHGADVRLLSQNPRLARVVVARLLARRTSFVFVAEPLLDALTDVLDPAAAITLRNAARIERAPLELELENVGDPRPPGFGPFVVWVGRAIPSKRLDVALRWAERSGARLVVVGDRPRELPRNVHAVGFVPREVALGWIAHASALVSTSLVEGSPTAVREARALDVPVVAFAAGDLERMAATDPGLHLVRTEAELASTLDAVLRTRIGNSEPTNQ
ncbi:MAG: glycosyltransferase family 4 protein [Polyangiaceae bacterium]